MHPLFFLLTLLSFLVPVASNSQAVGRRGEDGGRMGGGLREDGGRTGEGQGKKPIHGRTGSSAYSYTCAIDCNTQSSAGLFSSIGHSLQASATSALSTYAAVSSVQASIVANVLTNAVTAHASTTALASNLNVNSNGLAGKSVTLEMGKVLHSSSTAISKTTSTSTRAHSTTSSTFATQVAAAGGDSAALAALSSFVSTQEAALTVATTTYAASTTAALTTSTRASTTGAARASTTGGVLHKPQKCSPYVLFTLQGNGLSQPNPVFYGLWGQSQSGVTSLEVASVNVNKATSMGQTIINALPNQQRNGLECDFFFSSMMWDYVSAFGGGYTQALTPIWGESDFISDAVYCITNAALLTTSSTPLQIMYTHQVDNTWQVVRVQNSSQTSTFHHVAIVTMPVGSGEEVELTRYRVHALAQAYINLICTLTYTSGLEFITNYTTSANNIWDSVGVRCVRDGLDTTTDDIVYLQLVDAGNRFNLTVTSVAHTATSGGVSGQPVVVSSLQKNFGNPEETVFFGHQLQTRAVGAICSENGRFIQTCNDCVL